MQDRLVALLGRFQLRARVFQVGPLCQVARFEGDTDAGHLHVLRRGTLRVTTAGAPRLSVSEPSLIFYPRPIAHQLLPQGREGVDLVCATVEFGAHLQNPLTAGMPRLLVLPLAQHGSLADALRLLFSEASEAHCGQQAVIDRMIEVAIILLLRHLMDHSLVSSGVLAGLADPRLMKAINAMHGEPAKAWTLQALAEIAGMSRARFALRFREIVGQTPGSYLSDWRISLAQTLLRKGRPVNLVASEVGYESPSALARAFSAKLKLSPVAWVKREAARPDFAIA